MTWSWGRLKVHHHPPTHPFTNPHSETHCDLELDALKGSHLLSPPPPRVGQLDETIDADAMDLSDFRENESRKAFHIANDQTEVTTLQQQRRALLKALQEVKDDLQDVYRKETFNTATGVGESKSGTHTLFLDLYTFS